LKTDLKTLILYWSATGNTGKVACRIESVLRRSGLNPLLKKLPEGAEEELLDYDLVFLGAPSFQFLPPDPVQQYVKNKMKLHNQRGDVVPGAPVRPGKTAVIFCTYSGPHTGINEVVPVGEYLGQLFEHLGFRVAGKWYTVGEFHKRLDMSTQGRLGDIRGRPNDADLQQVEDNLLKLLATL
jgi:hypothetical protein